MVIEILSPATFRFDKEDKKKEYERSGVKEYWMIDPLDKTVEGFFLSNDKFSPLPTLQAQISFKMFDFTLNF